MEGVLEAATAWCACKLASSLLVLPWLPASRNAVSFCCCCLLVFSDVAVTGFLAFLCFSPSRPTEPSQPGDIIAFRFLLFLSHVYGAAMLLSCPLITLEALSRLWRPQVAPSPADGGGRARVGGAEEETEDGGARPDAEKRHSHGVSFLCCLLVWVAVVLHVRWRWMLEEVQAAACLITTNSPLTCLPRLTSSMASCASFYVIITFLLLLLLLLLKLDLRTCHRASAEAHRLNQNRLRGLIPAWGLPRMLASGGAPCVDPEKTVSSCAAPRAPAISSHEPFPTGRKQERTRSSKPLTFTAEAHEERCHRAFPCLGVDVIMGLMGVLGVFVLPLILSVNIVFIQTVDYLTEQTVQAWVAAPAAAKSNLPTSEDGTGSRSQQGSSFSQAGSNVQIC